MPNLKGWLVVRGIPKRYGAPYPSGHPHAGKMPVEEVRFVKFTKDRPAMDDDCVAFQVDLDVDEGWFLESVAKITGTIDPPETPDDIQVSVNTPIKPRGKSPAAQAIGNQP